jgi:hypothetical protein
VAPSQLGRIWVARSSGQGVLAGGSSLSLSSGAAFPGQAGNPVGFAATPANVTINSVQYSNTAYPGSLGAPPSLVGGSSGSPQIVTFKDFSGGISLASGTNFITFIGCRFQASGSGNFNSVIQSNNIAFSYCSFTPLVSLQPNLPSPSAGHSWPCATGGAGIGYVGGAQTYLVPAANGSDLWVFGRNLSNTLGALYFDHCDFWGSGQGCDIDPTPAGPVVFTDCWFHDMRDDTTGDHTDGVGNEQGGGILGLKINHCVFASVGNTSAIALQGAGTYTNLTITNNYLTQWGHLIQTGNLANSVSNAQVTDNLITTDGAWGVSSFSADVVFGNGTGNTWRRNTLLVIPTYPTAWGSGSTPSWVAGDNGKFILPDTTLSATDWPNGP